MILFSNQSFFTCRWYHQELCKVNWVQSQNLSPSLQIQKRYRIKLLFYHISLICWSQITVNVVKFFFLPIMLLIFVYTYFKQVTRYKLDHLCILHYFLNAGQFWNDSLTRETQPNKQQSGRVQESVWEAKERLESCT